MRVYINGQEKQLKAPLTVAQLLSDLHIDTTKVAIEHNLTILQPDHYNSAALNDNDKIEIVEFIGGG